MQQNDLCPEVLAFAKLMQKQIDNNSHLDKGDLRGWKTRTESRLLFELEDEMHDLIRAMEHLTLPPGGEEANVPSPEYIAKQAADVADLAMFIADRCGGLAESILDGK